MTKREQYKAEMQSQANAMRRILDGTKLDELEIIGKYAALWREIITSYEREQGRPATADELLWITGVTTHHNPCTD